MSNLLHIGGRLREERERLELSQEACAAVAGVTRKTLSGYEGGVRSPDAAALAAWSSVGFDVLYIVTGRRQGQGAGESAIYQATLDAVDLLSLERKVDAIQLAKAISKLVARANASQSKDLVGLHIGRDNNGQVAGTIVGSTMVTGVNKKR